MAGELGVTVPAMDDTISARLEVPQLLLLLGLVLALLVVLLSALFVLCLVLLMISLLCRPQRVDGTPTGENNGTYLLCEWPRNHRLSQTTSVSERFSRDRRQWGG